MSRLGFVTILLWLIPASVLRAEPEQKLTLTEFLHRVTQENLDLAAARFQVPLAKAQVEVAKVFPDPMLTGGVAQLDVSGQSAPLMTTLGVTLPIELGGKRSGRVAVAEAEVSVAEAELFDTLRKLRAEAASAYVASLTVRLVLERKHKTLASLDRLVEVNTKRVASGEAGEVALIQSRVENQRYRGEILTAEADLEAADLELRRFLGRAAPGRGQKLRVDGNLAIPPRLFDMETLCQAALKQRPDLLAKRRSEDSAQAKVRLARRNRWVDVSLNVSWQRSLFSEPFASPQYDALTAQLSLPLPLSRMYRGELFSAKQGEGLAVASYQAAALRAEVEVQQALVRYKAAVQQLALYTQGVVADADRVLAAILYSYQRGGATLLEVLTAQRTVDDVHLAYFAALAEHARQLIAVEQAAGLDVDLFGP